MSPRVGTPSIRRWALSKCVSCVVLFDLFPQYKSRKLAWNCFLVSYVGWRKIMRSPRGGRKPEKGRLGENVKKIVSEPDGGVIYHNGCTCCSKCWSFSAKTLWTRLPSWIFFQGNDLPRQTQSRKSSETVFLALSRSAAWRFCSSIIFGFDYNACADILPSGFDKLMVVKTFLRVEFFTSKKIVGKFFQPPTFLPNDVLNPFWLKGTAKPWGRAYSVC